MLVKNRLGCLSINKIGRSSNIMKFRYATNIFSLDKSIHGKLLSDAKMRNYGGLSDPELSNSNVQRLQNQIDQLKKESDILISGKKQADDKLQKILDEIGGLKKNVIVIPDITKSQQNSDNFWNSKSTSYTIISLASFIIIAWFFMYPFFTVLFCIFGLVERFWDWVWFYIWH